QSRDGVRAIIGNAVGIIFQHGNVSRYLSVDSDLALLNHQGIPWVGLYNTQCREDVAQMMHKLRRRERKEMPIQTRQVIGKPEPRSSRDHTASGEAGGCVQVNPMQRCGIGSLTLQQIKKLTAVQRPMTVPP